MTDKDDLSPELIVVLNAFGKLIRLKKEVEQAEEMLGVCIEALSADDLERYQAIAQIDKV